MMILGEGDTKKFTVTVQIRGSNRLKDGKRQNTVNQITVLDTTVEEVTATLRAALEAKARETQAKGGAR